MHAQSVKSGQVLAHTHINARMLAEKKMHVLYAMLYTQTSSPVHLRLSCSSNPQPVRATDGHDWLEGMRKMHMKL